MDAERLISALETHLSAAPGGWNDRRGLAKFNRLALGLMAKLAEPQGRASLRDACNWAEILYSTHGHRRRDRGLALLHQAVLVSLGRVRHSLSSDGGEHVVGGHPDRRRRHALSGHRYHP